MKLPKNQAEHRRELYRTEPAAKTLALIHKARPGAGRTDNKQLADKVRGRVITGAAKNAVQVTSTPEKTGMYEKPACGNLDTQKFLAKKRPKVPVTGGSRLRVPKDASAEEREKMARWLAEADAISAHLNR